MAEKSLDYKISNVCIAHKSTDNKDNEKLQKLLKDGDLGCNSNGVIDLMSMTAGAAIVTYASYQLF